MSVIVETVGVLGFITNVWANLLLARKSETGWAIRLGANVLWLVYGLAILSLANILSSVVFAGINVYGWRRWRKERLMPKTCEDHYRQDCKFCCNIVRQCRCHIGTDKPITRDGVCGVCAAQIQAPVTQACPKCIFCGDYAHGLYGPTRAPKCLAHSLRDLDTQLLAVRYHAIHGPDATIEGCPCCFP